jgi:hypothetical protein
MTMYFRDPNRPTPGASHPDPASDPRYLDQPGYGNAAEDGYTCVGRRPRVMGQGDILPSEEADRIEEMFRGFGGFGGLPRPRYGY